MLLEIIGLVAMIAPAPVLCIALRNRYLSALTALALLYPLGEWFQSLPDVPAWIRWHLSDVGFIPSAGLLFTVALFGISPREKFPDHALRGVSLAFAAGIGHESLGLFALRIEGFPLPTPGDWIDVAIFCIIYGLSFYLLRRMDQPSAPALPRPNND